MKSEIITTQTAKIWLGDDNITRNIHVPQAKVDLTDAKACVTACLKVNQGNQYIVLVDIRQVTLITHEARQYFSNATAESSCKARAILIGSHVSRIIGNFFIKINKPAAPTKLFMDEAKAIAWLNKFQQKNDDDP